MAKCNCAGSSCGCSIIAGAGAAVSGTGTANDPFVVSADLSQVSVANAMAVTSSTTIELGKKGSGTTADPVVLQAALTIRSPNQTRWTLAVSDTGVITAVPAPAAPTGASAGGTTVIANEILYWDPTAHAWPARPSVAEAIWVSLGSNNVPVPSGFKHNDTWLCEAT